MGHVVCLFVKVLAGDVDFTFVKKKLNLQLKDKLHGEFNSKGRLHYTLHIQNIVCGTPLRGEPSHQR